MPHIARTTVTAALPYANGPLHIGHLAGAYLPADIYVRYKRLAGQDVHFVCGSDEHGVAITIRARKEGLTPQEIIDKYHEINKKAFDDFGIQFDIFARTSSPVHHQTAQEFFRHFYENGLLQEKVSQQFFDPQEQMFLPDRYLMGTCPKCANPNAYGDQCEKCGTSLSATDLINPRSAINGPEGGATPEVRETRHWFLPLNDYQERLAKYVLEEHANDWKTNVFGQCKSWLTDGLQPRAITRDLEWGVPVPPEIPGAEGKVLYVWFDAPIGYISASKEWAAATNQPDAWKKYWRKDESEGATRLVHFIGKDNIVFHCIIFPAILMGHGEYIWADNVPANEFLNLEGEKMSTSRNWAVWAHEFAAEYPDKIDVMRYSLMSIFPETQDSDFNWKDFLAKNNNELVAIFGNFVNRVLTLLHKYYDGAVPEAIPQPEDNLALLEINAAAEAVGSYIEAYKFRAALAAAMDLARTGNKYLQEAEPWKTFKTDPARTAQVLYTATQLVAALGGVFRPFLPNTCDKIFKMLGINPIMDWNTLRTELKLVPAGHVVNSAELLFEKLDESFVEIQLAKLRAAAPAANAPALAHEVETLKDEIQFDDWAKIDLRAARVTHCEPVPKADKLLKLTLDLGTLGTRTVLSGIAEYYKPEDVVGRMVTLVANLAPRKMRGIESQGMILMAEDATGRLVFTSPAPDAQPGSGVR